MPTITIKNLPRDLHRELKNRAKAHHRSLNREMIATLRSAAAATQPLDAAALEHRVRRARALFPHPLTARQIDTWKRSGRL